MSGDLTQAYATLYATGEPDQGRDYQNLLIGAGVLYSLDRGGPVGHGTGRAPGRGDE